MIVKKEIYHYPLIYVLIPLALSVLGIILGSFLDLKISDGIVNTSSSMGAFIESYGNVFSFFMIPLTGVLIFKGLWTKDRTWMKVVGCLYLLFAIGMGIYECSIYFIGTTKIKEYGMVYTPWLGYLLSIIFMLFATGLFFYFIRSDKDSKALIIKGLIILFVLLSQTIIIEILKRFNCRPRYRYIIDGEINTSGENFASWWQFRPFSSSDDYHKSWPSGHTGMAGVCLLLPLIADHIRFPFRYIRPLLYIIGLGHCLLVAFYRVRYGAHFLSDVSFALLITSLIILVYLLLYERTTGKMIKNTSDRKEQL